MKRLAIIGLAVLMVMGLASAGWALELNIAKPNAALGPYPGPYATISITVTTANVASIAVTALPGFLIGDGSAVALNLNSSNFSNSAFTFTKFPDAYFNDPKLTSNPPPIGSGNVSTFGDFDFTATMFDGYPSAATSISFAITNLDASVNWTKAEDVLALNDKGLLAALHIFVFDPNDPASGAIVTGYAANKVPEPSTLLLLGAGLLGVGAMRRKFKR